MVSVPLGASYDNRAAARSPLVLVKNMVVEEALTNQAPTSFAGGISDPYQIDHKAWITRPGTLECAGPNGDLSAPEATQSSYLGTSPQVVQSATLIGSGELTLPKPVGVGNYIVLTIAGDAVNTPFESEFDFTYNANGGIAPNIATNIGVATSTTPPVVTVTSDPPAGSAQYSACLAEISGATGYSYVGGVPSYDNGIMVLPRISAGQIPSLIYAAVSIDGTYKPSGYNFRNAFPTGAEVTNFLYGAAGYEGFTYSGAIITLPGALGPHVISVETEIAYGSLAGEGNALLYTAVIFAGSSTGSTQASTVVVSPAALPGALCRGIFQQDGFADGALVLLYGETLYLGSPDNGYVEIGTVTGSDVATFACSTDNLLICAGSAAYNFDGATLTLTPIIMPSGQLISWVAYLAGYFVLGVLDARVIFFYVDGTPTVTALNYFSAETNAGNVLAGATLLDQLVLFKQNVTEFWQASGNPLLPFSRIIGQVYQRGAANRYAVAQSDNTLCFVGNDASVYECAATPVRVSTNAIEEQIRQNFNGPMYVWSFSMDGHSYYVLTLGTVATFVYDVLTESWLSWTDTNNNPWIGQIGAQASGSLVYASNPASPGLFTVSGAYTDDSGVPITREVMGGLAIIGPPIRCDNFGVVVDSGGGSDPLNAMEIDLQWSDDQGQTYSAWQPMYAGAAGQYSVQPVARMLGIMRQPSRIFHLRCSTLGPFRISYARCNEYFAMAWPSAPVASPP